MAQFQNNFVQDLTQKCPVRTDCGLVAFNADNLSNVVSVALYNGEEAYTGGGTVVGAVICPDGATVALDGTLSGNVASIILTGDCFALQGQIGVSIQIVSGDVRTTVLKAIYNVDISSTDTIVDPGSRITLSLAEIEAKLDEIPTILSEAQAAVDGIEAQKDTMIASIASVAGQGTDTTLTQSGVAADAKAAGDQISDLKSAYDNLISLEPFATTNVTGNVEEQNSKAVLTWAAAWRRTSFSVTQGELYNIQINTYNYGTQIVYVYVCESDDTIIDRYTNNSVNVMHTETISIKIPANAAKVYVRSFYDSSVSTLPLVYKVITAKHESEQALEWLGTYNTRKSVPIDVTAGNFENYTVGQKFIYGTGANWNIASFAPKNGASYVARVSTLNYNQAISYVLLCDENDEIVEVKNNSVTGAASIEEIPFTVGNSVKKAYVRCNYAVNNALEVYETSATVENMVGNAIFTKPYVYVACSDAPETQKSSADVVLPGTNDELVLQSIINTVCHNGGGKIKLSRGTVFIDSFPNKEANLDDYVALLIPQATPCTVAIEGDVLGMASGGTAFLITSDCYADLDSTKQYTVIRGGHRTYPFNSNLSFRMHDVRIDLPWNQKPIRCIDCLYFNQVLIERVTMSAFKNGYGEGWNVAVTTPPAVAVEGCEGLRATGGSNYGILDDYRNVFVTGFYKGFRLSGEHLVGINLSAIFCVYGYTFGDYNWGGGSNHPITLINCCDERNVNLPLFVANGESGNAYHSGNQAISFVDFNVERIADYTPGGELGDYATEQYPGVFKGEINYTIQDEFGGHGNSVDVPFWATGSGNGMVSRNQAQLQACDTATRLTYAPNYMQKIYDTTLNKLVIYNGSAWVDTNGSVVD